MSKALLFGLVVLAATGCATGSRTALRDGSYAGSGSPTTSSEEVRRCEFDGGWYDFAAGACDLQGPGD
jgi:hypothetical protein